MFIPCLHYKKFTLLSLLVIFDQSAKFLQVDFNMFSTEKDLTSLNLNVCHIKICSAAVFPKTFTPWTVL